MHYRGALDRATVCSITLLGRYISACLRKHQSSFCFLPPWQHWRDPWLVKMTHWSCANLRFCQSRKSEIGTPKAAVFLMPQTFRDINNSISKNQPIFETQQTLPHNPLFPPKFLHTLLNSQSMWPFSLQSTLNYYDLNNSICVSAFIHCECSQKWFCTISESLMCVCVSLWGMSWGEKSSPMPPPLNLTH